MHSAKFRHACRVYSTCFNFGQTGLFLFWSSSHFDWKCTFSAQISFSCCWRAFFVQRRKDPLMRPHSCQGGCRVEPPPLRLLSVGCRRLSFYLDGTRVLNRIIMSLVARTSLNCKLFSLSSLLYSSPSLAAFPGFCSPARCCGLSL